MPGFLCVLGFILLRPHIKFYEARRHIRGILVRPPPLSHRGVVARAASWLVPVFSISDAELVRSAGLDALMVHRTLSYGLLFFGPTAVVGCAVLLPLYATAGGTSNSSSSSSSSRIQKLAQLALGNLPPGSRSQLVPFFFCIAALVYGCWLLDVFLKEFILLRQVRRSFFPFNLFPFVFFAAKKHHLSFFPPPSLSSPLFLHHENPHHEKQTQIYLSTGEAAGALAAAAAAVRSEEKKGSGGSRATATTATATTARGAASAAESNAAAKNAAKGEEGGPLTWEAIAAAVSAPSENAVGGNGVGTETGSGGETAALVSSPLPPPRLFSSHIPVPLRKTLPIVVPGHPRSRLVAVGADLFAALAFDVPAPPPKTKKAAKGTAAAAAAAAATAIAAPAAAGSWRRDWMRAGFGGASENAAASRKKQQADADDNDDNGDEGSDSDSSDDGIESAVGVNSDDESLTRDSGCCSRAVDALGAVIALCAGPLTAPAASGFDGDGDLAISGAPQHGTSSEEAALLLAASTSPALTAAAANGSASGETDSSKRRQRQQQSDIAVLGSAATAARAAFSLRNRRRRKGNSRRYSEGDGQREEGGGTAVQDVVVVVEAPPPATTAATTTPAPLPPLRRRRNLLPSPDASPEAWFAAASRLGGQDLVDAVFSRVAGRRAWGGEGGNGSGGEGVVGGNGGDGGDANAWGFYLGCVPVRDHRKAHAALEALEEARARLRKAEAVAAELRREQQELLLVEEEEEEDDDKEKKRRSFFPSSSSRRAKRLVAASDTVGAATEQLREAGKAVEEAQRETLREEEGEEGAHGKGRKKNPHQPTAFFALFSSPAAASAVASVPLFLQGWRRSFRVSRAPGADEVCWQALWTSPSRRRRGRVSAFCWLAFFVGLPVGIFAGALANLEHAACSAQDAAAVASGGTASTATGGLRGLL